MSDSEPRRARTTHVPRGVRENASSTPAPSKTSRSFHEFLLGILERNPPNDADAASDTASCSEPSTASEESDGRSEYTCGSESEHEKNVHTATDAKITDAKIAATLPSPTTKFLLPTEIKTVIKTYAAHMKNQYQEEQLSHDIPLDFKVWIKGSNSHKQELVKRQYFIGRLRKLSDTIQIGQHSSVEKTLKQCHNLDETIKDLARSELKLGRSPRIRSRKNLRRKHQGIEHTGILERAQRMDWKEIKGSGDRDLLLAKALSALNFRRLRNLAGVLAKNRCCPRPRGSISTTKVKHPPKQKRKKRSSLLPRFIKRALAHMVTGDKKTTRIPGVKGKKGIFLLMTMTLLFISWTRCVQIPPGGLSSKELKSAQDNAAAGRRNLNTFLEALNGILSEFGAIMVLRKRWRKILKTRAKKI